MTKSYLATQFWEYMSDKCLFYLFSKIIKKSNTRLVAIQSYKQKKPPVSRWFISYFFKNFLYPKNPKNPIKANGQSTTTNEIICSNINQPIFILSQICKPIFGR